MKLLAFTLVLLLSGANAFAMPSDSIRTEIICEEGYKFLVVFSTHKYTGPTVTQIFAEGPNNLMPPQPMKCSK